MDLEVVRFSSGSDCTNGILFDVSNRLDGRKFLCYTLEDEQREEKVKGETRIPAGSYEIQIRDTGGFHSKYSKRFGDLHRGMLHVTDVPGFEYILIHCGNTDEHTAGCLLVGDSQENNQIKKDGFIGRSTQAYKRVYEYIMKSLEEKESVVITYIDFDGPSSPITC
tara:strand:- start:4105 stop:4602 length:498 start_codon:yes stop_codon:yes gene_type:complete